MYLLVWNILSLNIIGAFKTVKDELYKYRVAIATVLLESWRGNKMFDSNDFMAFLSGNKEKLLFGAGFIIHKN